MGRSSSSCNLTIPVLPSYMHFQHSSLGTRHWRLDLESLFAGCCKEAGLCADHSFVNTEDSFTTDDVQIAVRLRVVETTGVRLMNDFNSNRGTHSHLASTRPELARLSSSISDFSSSDDCSIITSLDVPEVEEAETMRLAYLSGSRSPLLWACDIGETSSWSMDLSLLK